jgi:hypothetical protein
MITARYSNGGPYDRGGSSSFAFDEEDLVWVMRRAPSGGIMFISGNG